MKIHITAWDKSCCYIYTFKDDHIHNFYVNDNIKLYFQKEKKNHGVLKLFKCGNCIDKYFIKCDSFSCLNENL